jgi:hypothetical protein
MKWPKLIVDVKGCFSKLNPEADQGKFCVVCDKHKRKREGTLCKRGTCPFPFHSAPKAGEPSRVGMGGILAKFVKVRTDECYDNGVPIYRQAFAKDVEDIGKCQFFYFCYHPWLEWELPELPDKDSLGNIRKGSKLQKELGLSDDDERVKVFKNTIHHINDKHWDDRFFNLEHTLNTLHPRRHLLMNREKAGTLELLHEEKVKELLK